MPKSMSSSDSEAEFDPATCPVCAYSTQEPSVVEAHLSSVHGVSLADLVNRRPSRYDKLLARSMVLALLASTPAAESRDISSRLTPAFWADSSILSGFDSTNALAYCDEDESCSEESVAFAEVTSAMTAEKEVAVLRDKVAVLQAVIDRLESPDEASTASSSAQKEEPVEATQTSKEDSTYFSCYQDQEIHRVMILDHQRTGAYQDFILGNAELFAGAVVLDVGCGTGVLSMFAKQAGARLVVGLDAAEKTLALARKVTAANGHGDIQLVAGKVEDHSLFVSAGKVIAVPTGASPPPNAEPFVCDIIISEWMGYGLMFESMLYTVLDARDRYLRPGGRMLPNGVVLRAHLADWKSRMAVFDWGRERPYGLDFSLLQPAAEVVLRDAIVEEVPKSLLRSDGCVMGRWDLERATRGELESWRGPVDLTAKDYATSLVLSFDTLFAKDKAALAAHLAAAEEAHGLMDDGSVNLSTSPVNPVTHWKQTLLHLKSDSTTAMRLEPGQRFEATLSLAKHPENSRQLLIGLEQETQAVIFEMR